MKNAEGRHNVLLSCFPFSKPEKIKGAWYYGSETNAFVEGEQVQAGNHAPPIASGNSTRLAYYDPKLPNDGLLRVLQVELVGRRSECPMGYPNHVIVVEQMMTRTIKFVSKR